MACTGRARQRRDQAVGAAGAEEEWGSRRGPREEEDQGQQRAEGDSGGSALAAWALRASFRSLLHLQKTAFTETTRRGNGQHSACHFSNYIRRASLGHWQETVRIRL